MIEYISGRMEALTPTTAVIDVSGVGYLCNISLNTYAELEGHSQCRLLVHEKISEDAHTLFGFATADERTLFRELIGVSGVGAATAMLILSAFGTAHLRSAIASGDAKALKNVKGVGAKTAERIIVDLRDKIKPGADTLVSKATPSSDVFDEALAALIMLGYTKANAQKALKKLLDANPTMRVEAAIKQALAMM